MIVVSVSVLIHQTQLNRRAVPVYVDRLRKTPDIPAGNIYAGSCSLFFVVQTKVEKYR
jgi:hypothetical protein